MTEANKLRKHVASGLTLNLKEEENWENEDLSRLKMKKHCGINCKEIYDSL